MRKSIGNFLFVIMAAFVCPLAGAEPVAGRVVDGAERDAGKAGVVGVIVEIQDKSGKVLGKTMTGKDGSYKLDVPNGASMAIFTKAQYLSRPAYRSLDLANSTQADVILAKENQEPDYYRALAYAFNGSGPRRAGQYAEIVDLLPTRNKNLVVESLTSSEAVDALSKIETQRLHASIQREQKIRAAMETMGAMGISSPTVHAPPTDAVSAKWDSQNSAQQVLSQEKIRAFFEGTKTTRMPSRKAPLLPSEGASAVLEGDLPGQRSNAAPANRGRTN